jgi:hypothetical protein
MTRREIGARSFEDADRLADAVIQKIGKTIVLALPLGLGKANHIANALFARAISDPSIRLNIFTALTLEKPRARNEIERRFLAPLTDRLFAGYPDLTYAAAIRAGTLPANIQVNEFFFQAGQWLGVPHAQQNYISANYTHALRYVLDRGVNVIAQLVARRNRGGDGQFSLSCNPDLTLDLLTARRDGRANFLLAGQINSELHSCPTMPKSRPANLISFSMDRTRTFRFLHRRENQSNSRTMPPVCMPPGQCRTVERCKSGSDRLAMRSSNR